LEDEQKMGQDRCLQLVEKRWQGLQKLTQRLGKKNIDFQNHGGYELLAYQKAETLREEMLRYNELLRPIFKVPVYSDRSNKITSFGFEGIQGLLFNRFEGQINTGNMMHTLWQYAQKKGAKIITGAEVTHFEEGRQGVELHVKPDVIFKAGKIIICTNAFAKQFFPAFEIRPGRGQVLITQPLPTPLRFQGTFHMEAGFYYFRNFENRVLFGGGRNIDFATETTTEFALTERIQQDLEKKLREIILPHQSFEIDMRWAGIMAFSDDKQPIKQQTSAHTWLVARLNGMGVALASQLAEEVAQEIF
jgi:glycine/D-amino acid oxidase-like deaminating enzyme